MSVQIYQSPSAVSFAGNPVLMKAITNMSNKTFLKVCVRLTANLFKSGMQSQNAVFNLSIPTDGGGEATMFDFSSCMQSMFSQVEKSYFDLHPSASETSGYVRYSFKVWDEYLDSANEVISTEASGATSSGTFVAIPGAYTDAQRLFLPEDTASLLGAAKVISNKPDGENIPLDGNFVLPVYSIKEGLFDIIIGTGSDPISRYAWGEKTSWCKVSMSGVPAGRHTISFGGIVFSSFDINVIPPQPFTTYFEFYNRLGALESIYCYGRRQVGISIQSERSMRYQGMSFRPNGRYAKRNVTQEQTIALSTGVVSKTWAKWFVEEFLQSEHVWMMDEEIGQMIPVIIEVDDETNLYDEMEAQVIDIEFDVVKSINGYDTGSHLK